MSGTTAFRDGLATPLLTFGGESGVLVLEPGQLGLRGPRVAAVTTRICGAAHGAAHEAAGFETAAAAAAAGTRASTQAAMRRRRLISLPIDPICGRL